MRLFLYSDVHWSETSSIVRSRGEKYSTRLENLIRSVNWAEEQAAVNGCDAVVCLGDFFDRPNLTAEEITALTEIKWADMPHTFLVGNHDANRNDLSYASTFALNQFDIVSEPVIKSVGSADILYLPYLTEDNRKPLSTYFDGCDKMAFRNKIVLSHNDIAGIWYGAYLSEAGFEVNEILTNCDLFINGHLHNSGYVDDREHILNLGNLSGQNFNEDATKYEHYCAVLDTETLQLTFMVNPYAFNFYKLKIETPKDLELSIKLNAVLSIQCPSSLTEKVRATLQTMNYVSNNRCIVAYRIQSYSDAADREIDISELTQLDHLQKFSEYVLSHLDNTKVLREELEKVVGYAN